MSQEDEAYALAHFGVKGMHWGVRNNRSTGSRAIDTKGRGKSATPIRPKVPIRTGSKAKGDEILARAIQQAYRREVDPAVSLYRVNQPTYHRSADPKVNEVLDRLHRQALNRVETEAGRKFIEGLPPGINLR